MTFNDFLFKRFNANLKKNFRYLLVIIIIDLIPLYAVLYKGWDAVDAVYLYFIETLLLAWFAILKMLRAKHNIVWLGDMSQKAGNSRITFLQRLSNFISPASGVVRKSFKFVFILVFLIISIPIAIFELTVMNLIAGLAYFGNHLSGEAILGLKLFWWVLLLMFAEHLFYYRRHYVNKKEYNHTGVINEGLNITIRIVVQQFVMIFGLLIAASSKVSTFVALGLIIYKLLVDIISFLYNRYWGEETDKEFGSN
ncbi:MAG: DUF6498-containing protein [Bacteroidia bacterium]|nr:DUF6498-containing protein [Bacteroidia bacterium]